GTAPPAAPAPWSCRWSTCSCCPSAPPWRSTLTGCCCTMRRAPYLSSMAPLHTEKTSTGLEANLAAALSYLVGFVTGIIFLLIEKDNKFVRFHAMQSTFVFIGILAIDILLQIVPLLGALVVIFIVIPASAALWLFL